MAQLREGSAGSLPFRLQLLDTPLPEFFPYTIAPFPAEPIEGKQQFLRMQRLLSHPSPQQAQSLETVPQGCLHLPSGTHVPWSPRRTAPHPKTPAAPA